MTRAARLVPLAVAATAVGAAGGDGRNVAGALLGGGFVVACFVVLALPVALALHAFRRDWLAREARVVERSTTACGLAGAGVVVATVFAVALTARFAPLAWLLLCGATAWFAVGFAGCARRHGERMLGTDAQSGARTLVLGFLARAGLFALPVAWPLTAAYLVAVACGAPLVALFTRDSARIPPDDAAAAERSAS